MMPLARGGRATPYRFRARLASGYKKSTSRRTASTRRPAAHGTAHSPLVGDDSASCSTASCSRRRALRRVVMRGAGPRQGVGHWECVNRGAGPRRLQRPPRGRAGQRGIPRTRSGKESDTGSAYRGVGGARGGGTRRCIPGSDGRSWVALGIARCPIRKEVAENLSSAYVSPA